MTLTRELIDFLDLHEFSDFELCDTEYISDKIDIFSENAETEIDLHTSLSLAKEYAALKLNR